MAGWLINGETPNIKWMRTGGSPILGKPQILRFYEILLKSMIGIFEPEKWRYAQVP